MSEQIFKAVTAQESASKQTKGVSDKIVSIVEELGKEARELAELVAFFDTGKNAPAAVKA